MAAICTKCKSKENYNFALNIGLCDVCIGEELEKVEEYHNQYHQACAKLSSHKSIIKQMQKAYKQLQVENERLKKVLSDVIEEIDEDHCHNTEYCDGCPICIIEQALGDK